MDGESSMVMEDVCGDDIRNLGGRLVLKLMRGGGDGNGGGGSGVFF